MQSTCPGPLRSKARHLLKQTKFRNHRSALRPSIDPERLSKSDTARFTLTRRRASVEGCSPTIDKPLATSVEECARRVISELPTTQEQVGSNAGRIALGMTDFANPSSGSDPFL